MMKEVVFINDDKQILAHSVANPDVKLIQPLLSTDVVLISQLAFSITPSHPASGFINEYKTKVLARDIATSEIIFDGLIMKRNSNSQNKNAQVRYIAEDALAYLKFTRQKAGTYKDTPKNILKHIIDRHNDLTENERQFAIGNVEIDTYIVYVEGSSNTNVTLRPGDTATIKPTAQYIYDHNGTRLRMADYVKGRNHKVVERMTSGANNGRYHLAHFTAGYSEGFVAPQDIVETYVPIPASEPTNTQVRTDRYPPNTSVRIKSGVTTYYREATGKGITTIPTNLRGLNYRTLNYVVRDYSKEYKRYSIYYNGIAIAWIDEADLDFGNTAKPNQPIPQLNKPSFVTKRREIEAELTYDETSLEAIKKHLLTPFNAEIEWEMVEGVRTIHIRNRIERETAEKITAGLNLISTQESFDPTNVATGLIPIGHPPGQNIENNSHLEGGNSGNTGETSGTRSQPTAQTYDDSKSSGATALSTTGWSAAWVNRFNMNAADPPYVNGAYIDTFLRRYYPDSPLIGQGNVIKEMSDYFGVSVGAALGVWAKETTFGRGEPGKSNYNYGCIRHTGEYPAAWWGGSAWNNYPNKRVGIAEWFQLLRDNYINKGYVNYNDFLNRYSPTFENDHSTFKNLMWAQLKSFGYDTSDTTVKKNYSTPGEDTRNINLNMGVGGGSAPDPGTTKGLFSHFPTVPSKSRINYGFAAPGYPSHRGTDIVYLDGSSNIYAVDSGIVEAGQSSCYVGNRDCGGGWGNYVRIRHANGYKTLYAHLSSLSVSVGQSVTAGQIIGQMGNTGRSDGKHLHLELWEPNNNRIDPESKMDFSGYQQLFK